MVRAGKPSAGGVWGHEQFTAGRSPEMVVCLRRLALDTTLHAMKF
jgi:hypothetical protein